MAIVCPNAGEKRILQLIVNKNYSTGATTGVPLPLYLHLFTQSTIALPERVSSANMSTVLGEPTIGSSGYTPIALVGANWTVDSANPTTGSDTFQGSYATQTFSFTQDFGTVSGYFISCSGPAVSAGYEVLWFETNSNGPIVFHSGDSLTITPKLVLD